MRMVGKQFTEEQIAFALGQAESDNRSMATASSGCGFAGTPRTVTGTRATFLASRWKTGSAQRCSCISRRRQSGSMCGGGSPSQTLSGHQQGELTEPRSEVVFRIIIAGLNELLVVVRMTVIVTYIALR
jgi:hypothetical protein